MEMTLLNIITQRRLATDKHSFNFYVQEYYEKAFAPYREKAITLLEIGVHKGGSLELWAEYFPKGHIYGIDICLLPEVEQDLREHPRIHLYREDAYTQAMSDSLPYFNIIIDDANHLLVSQVECLRYYFPRLLPGGKLIIEDVISEREVECLKTICQVYGGRITHHYVGPNPPLNHLLEIQL